MQSYNSFSLINFSCEGSFFFGQSSKRLSANHLRCEHRRFYKVTSVGLVLYILADLGPHGKLLTKQTSFLLQPYAWLARITLRNFSSLFSLATMSLASLTKTHIHGCDTTSFSNGTPLSQLRTTQLGKNGGHDPGQSAQHQQLAVIMRIYT